MDCFLNFLSIFDESVQHIIAVDESGRIIYANQSACEILEYRAEKLLGKPFRSLIFCGESSIDSTEQCRPVMLLSKNGKRLTCSISVLHGSCEKQKVRIFSFQETSTAEISEQALLSAIINSLPDFIYMKNDAGVYVHCNHAFAEKFLGVPESEILGKTDSSFLQGGRISGIGKIGEQEAIKSRSPVSCEESMVLADGTEMIADTLKVPCVDENGNVRFMIGIARDITKRKQLEEKLGRESRKNRLLYELYNQASKQEQLGEFIGYVRKTLTRLYPLDGTLFYLFSKSRGKMLLFSCHGLKNQKDIDAVSVLDENDGMIKPLFSRFPHGQGKSRQGFSGDLAGGKLEKHYDYSLIFPIVFRNELLGCVVFLQKRTPLAPGQFTLLPYICDALSIVIHNFILSEKQKQNYMELLNAENQLVQEKARAESENLEKSQFLATMSHEIRTPLNGIIGFLDLLSESDLNREQKIYVANARSASQTLLPLINDILDISKIESGGLVLEKIDFPLIETVQKAVELHLPLARSKNLSIDLLAPEEGLPKYVRGDPMRFREILNNLISNAVKFTSKGVIEVEVKCLSVSRSTVTLAFRVSDTGIGIEKGKLKNLFKPYSQGDSSTSRRYGGTGLGLAICKELVEQMGGRIHVKSTLGTGSVFSYTIKLGTASEPDFRSGAASPNKEKGLCGNIPNARILLAEDNEINRQLVILSLKKSGLACDVACNGIEAVTLASSREYDLIFMDCQMPEMDGYEATARIRKAEVGRKHTAIIAMTANSMSGDRTKCFDAGMDDYLSKPIDFPAMFGLIQKYCSSGR